ncbi:Receptor-type guanylate cyclase gcy [Seminavis robusta]|uniref:Receptor-type guanylate cyclase gcy n=1 Tax=Seminavis robusta TaxID=568900 RepID=A0A9N8E436_9STRA|nr:Receptor-type guanylate cyclase gcy [Seminavis robusta]|eukprot:Sro634_g179040.1 Receptor-type guanylate cyclase gcy (1182) ;mRNA; r:44820-49883
MTLSSNAIRKFLSPVDEKEAEDPLNWDTTSVLSSSHNSVGDDEAQEVKEVEQAAKKDTIRINRWRIVLMLLLFATAVTLTVLTYITLDAEQENNFTAAYNEFSLTVEDAVVRQQTAIRNSLRSFSHQLSSTAHSLNATWPFFTLPDFEIHAGEARSQSQTEFLGVFNIVNHTDRLDFEEYADYMHRDWIKEGHQYRYGSLKNLDQVAYHPYITRAGSDFGTFDAEDEFPNYVVSWTYSPPPVTYGATNHNQRGPLYDAVLKLGNETLMGPIKEFKLGGIVFSTAAHDAFHSKIKGSSSDFPHGQYLHPVHRQVANPDSDVVAILELIVGFDVSMRNLLPDTVKGLVAVLSNTCGQIYTYEISGRDAFYVGPEDLHDTQFDVYRREFDLAFLTHPNASSTPGHCVYKMELYPSTVFKDQYYGSTPIGFTVAVALTFVLIAVVFVCYDVFVQRRNTNMIYNAAKTSALVTSMFPRHIRDQLMQQNESRKNKKRSKGGEPMTKSSKMRSFLTDGDSDDDKGRGNQGNNSLADLYLETSVMFADIQGFTAWSSTREPCQVFEILEGSFTEMDRLARKIGIFKVETVGDCYVAVAGLPEPRHDHVVAITRFATASIRSFGKVMQRMEVKLGPDCSDLQLRIGIHSGPVTAGVLRGDRARFQLFGDTVNTCARIESSGTGGKIHVSDATATLLTNKGMGNWLVPRSAQIEAKGKGLLTTYWVEQPEAVANKSPAVVQINTESGTDPSESSDLFLRSLHHRAIAVSDDKVERLIMWNTDTLLKLLKHVVARRMARQRHNGALDYLKGSSNMPDSNLEKTNAPIEEVKEIIELPEFNTTVAKLQPDPETIKLHKNVAPQLRMVVSRIAAMYNQNSFHNFEHASHVVMSVTKILSRIVQPAELEEEIMQQNGGIGTKAAASESLHDHTYGITSDPLTHFACAWSALIHDVDHLGVPNTQLVEEKTETSIRYNNRSVAEQNSLDLAWNLLMEDQFSDLRAAIFSNGEERARFRALVVNAVMATDIADKDLKALRNARWDKAFKKGDVNSSDPVEEQSPRDAVNRKATIVIEHIIQASDISHTMQHWHVYRKWNERLFAEMYFAYKEGRAKTNPADFWAKGEIGFFDFYIIPLAKKLKDCGVFGISSGEFLSYANQNRNEWETKGPQIVAEMVEIYGKNEEKEFQDEEVAVL